jgi:Immunity protein Imm1
MRRDANGRNCFWLSHDDQPYPFLGVLVKGDLAYVHYFPEDRHAGHRSLGNLPGLDPEGLTTFYLDEGTPQEILNDGIVLFEKALAAAKEFHQSPALPRSIEWQEL